MGIARSMTGTPWHEERMHRAEGDVRRHKSRCKYYSSFESCLNPDGLGVCYGPAHCEYYVHMGDDEFKRRQAERRKESKSTSQAKRKKGSVPKKTIKDGAKQYIDANIVGGNQFKHKSPSEVKPVTLKDTSGNIPGIKLSHVSYGIGEVISINKDYIYVLFECGEKQFKYGGITELLSVK